MRPHRKKWLTAASLASLALLGWCFVAGCASGPNSLLRQNALTRSLFYPESFAPGKKLGPDSPGQSFDHAAYAALLKRIVLPDGTVDYGALAESPDALAGYIDALAAANLDALSQHARFALLVNAYNAFTLQLMLEHPGVQSIKDIPADQRWKARRWSLDGQTVSLDELEHQWLRKVFNEPRVHFALVCASKGCPPLRGEPFAAPNLSGQLDNQARRYFSNPRNLRWEASSNTLFLSELLDWFANDFGPDRERRLAFFRPYLPDGVREAVLNRGVKSVRVKYLPYDWTINGTW